MSTLLHLALLTGCAGPAALTPIKGLPAGPAEWVTPAPPEPTEAVLLQSRALLEAAERSAFYTMGWADLSGLSPAEHDEAVRRAIRVKREAMAPLVETYQTVLAIGAWEPSLDALLGLGLVYMEMAAFIEDAPLPSGLSPRQHGRHLGQVQAEVTPLYEASWEHLEDLVTRTGAYRWYGPQRRAAIAMLRASAPSEYALVTETLPPPPEPSDRPGRDPQLDDGYAAWAAGDTQLAAQHFGAVMESAYWHRLPSLTRAEAGHPYRSLLVLTAEARDANNREAALALGLLAAENDDPSLALDAFDWLPLRPDVSRDELLAKAVSWRADQNLAGAKALYKMALSAAPEDPLAALNLSTLQAEYAGDFVGARAALAPYADEPAVAERLEELDELEAAAARGQLAPAVQSSREARQTLAALDGALEDYERTLKAARCPVNDDDLVAAELVLEQSRALLEAEHADRALDAVRRLVWFSMSVEELIPECAGSAARPVD